MAAAKKGDDVPQQKEIEMVPVPKAPEPKQRKQPKTTRLDEMKAKLEVAPQLMVKERTYEGNGDPEKAEGAARNAAYQVNVGSRKQWPNDVYYGAFEGNALLIGRKDHMPEDWRPFVEKAGSMKRKADEPEKSGGDVEFSGEDPFVTPAVAEDDAA